MAVNELFNLLEQNGPLLVKATFGIDSYVPNSAKKLKTIKDVEIRGWDKQFYIDSGALHATIIVGVENIENDLSRSRVYFLDPRQIMDPNLGSKHVYSVSFQKYMEKTQNIYTLKNYGLTEEIKQLEEDHKRPLLKGGFYTSKMNNNPETCPTINNETSTLSDSKSGMNYLNQ